MARLHDERWSVLQRKIFTRFATQKLREVDVTPMKDVCTDLTGFHLAHLAAKLSEIDPPSLKKCPRPEKAKMRVHKIDSASNALDFVYKTCGVKQNIKTSSENVVNGEERPILGLIWAIIIKFERFGDDDEQNLDAKTSLLMWVKNQVKNYPVEIKSFTSSFQNGMALAALIHKHRPALIDFDSLSTSDPHGNLELVFAAAEKYFGLERYLEVGDISQLDDKSMMIYVGEYYVGISQQRKLDLAARRISALIEWTQKNDAIKEEYNAKAKELCEGIVKVEALLGDRTVDNTLAGARAKLEAFTAYKKNDKSGIIGNFLDLERLFNNLALRLSDKNRPPFVPAEGCALADLGATLKRLSEAEAERNTALHAELNRQLVLVELAKQHKSASDRLQAWIATKKEYLNTKEDITSSGAAQFQINVLKAFDAESAQVQASQIPDLKKLGAQLASETYENQTVITDAETAVDAGVTELSGLSVEKMKVLEDDFAREQFREAIELKASQHTVAYEQLTTVFNTKDTVFGRKEAVDSVQSAKYFLAVLENEKQDLMNTQDTQSDLKKLGEEILAAKYEGLTSYAYPTPEEISTRHEDVATRFEGLKAAAEAKKAVLEGDLVHEQKKDELSLSFANSCSSLASWLSNATEQVTGTVFGLTLSEVEAFQSTLDQSDAELKSKSEEQVSCIEAVFTEGTAVSFDAAVYTSETVESCKAKADALSQALAERRASYEAELAEQRRKDALCKDFATVAEEFVASLQKNKDQVTAASGSLEEQLASVDALIAAGDNGAVADIRAKDQAVVAEGITHNLHTLLNFDEVQTQFGDYQKFLEAKKELIESEIAHKKLRGLTQEQMEEIDNNFKEFDRDSSGALSKNEFKACLYSLGFEKGKKEIEGLMEQHGKDGSVTYDGFRDFMIGELGDQGTQDEVVKGLRLINRYKDAGVTEYSEMVFKPEDMTYILATAPKPEEEGDYDYRSWTATMFSR